MTEDLRRKLQDLQSLFDSGLLSAEDYAREKANLLAAWRQSAPAPAPTEPPLPLAPLPTVIALPLREYRDETHPVLKLWYACDSVELLLRLVVMLAVAERTRRGPLDAALRRRLHDCGLEQPSLGAWRALADALVPTAPDADALLPELPALLRDTLLPLLDGPVGSARTETTSFSALRNRLAHGGGIRRALAERLVARWDAPFLDAMRHTAWLATVDLVVRDGRGGYGVLRGPTPQAQPYTPADPAALARAFAAGDAVALVRGAVALPLWPLALYGVPRGADPDAPPATELVPQVYVRRGEVRLQYNPLGADHLALSESEDAALHRFLELFRLVDETPAERTRRFTVRDFQDEIRQEARKLIGRASECAILAEALATTMEGVLWVWGTAGVGKSCLLAWLTAHQLAAPPPDTLVLPYRFRVGDERCNREAFLRFAGERLMAWLQLPDDPSAETMPLLRRLRETLARLDGKRLWFVLDGLDEIAALDPRFAVEVPLALAGPGIVWLCAGRPEMGLPAAFQAARQPFPAGVPGMSEGDIRSLLLERIGPLRKHLLRHDREQGERVGNPFVEQVARAADGLPLYVHYVIHDIFAGLYRVLDGHERLPPSLAAYHENLLCRLSVGSLQQVLTPLAATLAVAQEPLAAPALAALLRRRGKLVPEGVAGLTLVEHGLAAIATLLKRAPTPAGEDGYALYHLSLRQQMATSAQSRDAVATAREALADLAVDVPPDPAAPYLYRQGIGHLLELRRTPEALALLTRFAYLMDRLRALPDPDGVIGISADWRATLQQSGPLAGDDRLWEAFWREREHILRRGDARWPAYRILLQLAVEHADDSPVTRQAEAWERSQANLWPQIVSITRPAQTEVSAYLQVLERHTGLNAVAITSDDKHVVSGGGDTLRVWDLESGICLRILEGHTDWIRSVVLTPDGKRAISESAYDRTLRVWDIETGICLRILENITNQFTAVALTSDGRLAVSALEFSGAQQVWNIDTGTCLRTLKNAYVSGDTIVAVTSDGDYVIWVDAKLLHLHDLKTGSRLYTFEGHTDRVIKLAISIEGHVAVSGSLDNTLRVWDLVSGFCTHTLLGHTKRITAIAISHDGRRAISSGKDKTLRVWDLPSGICMGSFEGLPTYSNAIALTSDDQRAVCADNDGSIRVLDLDSIICPYSSKVGHTSKIGHTGMVGCLALTPEKDQIHKNHPIFRHTGMVSCLALTPDGHRAVSGSYDQTLPDQILQVWDLETGSCLHILKGHTDYVTCVAVTPDGFRAISGSYDQTLRIWNLETGGCLHTLKEHAWYVSAVAVPSDSRQFVSGSWDETLRVWNIESGVCLHILEGHTDPIRDVAITPNGLQAISVSSDKTIRLWNIETGACLHILYGHTDLVESVDLTPDGHRAVSGSYDHTLRVWDLETGDCLHTLKGHTDRVVAVAITADGQQVVSASSDRTLRIWSLDSDTCLLTWMSEYRIRCLALAGNNRIVVGDLSGSIWLLQIIDDQLSQKMLSTQPSASATTV